MRDDYAERGYARTSGLNELSAPDTWHAYRFTRSDTTALRSPTMRTRLIAAAGMLFLLSGIAHAQGSRVVGLWTLDLERSKLPATFPLASETRSYTLRDDGYLVALAIRLYGGGQPEFIQVVAKPDGKDYPQYQSGPLAEFQIHGTTTPFTYSETQADESTVKVIAKVNGKVNNTGTRTVSEDGQTMTLDVTAILPDDQKLPILLVFARQGKGP
jgi:hypothetical protein